MRNRIPWRVTSATFASGLQNLPRFLPAVHFSVRDRKADGHPTTEVLRLFIKSDGVIKASHFSVKGGHQRFTVKKCRIKLQRALASGHRFIDQSEVSVDLAGEIANPQRGRINFRRAA